LPPAKIAAPDGGIGVTVLAPCNRYAAQMGHLTRSFLLICLLTSPVAAQDPPPEHQHPVEDHPPEHQHGVAVPTANGWTLNGDANVFGGFNYQSRRYFDFAAWESQNWFMGVASHPAGRGRVALNGMLTLEPLTIGRYVYRVDDGSQFEPGGSPQLFQTGETFEQLPLMGYQHPHDLIMELGATYTGPRGRLTYTVGADLVGSATLGPVPFMHRESARNNPQVPLGHHLLDSTHISAGVIRGGVTVSEWTFESSLFGGAEPDEERYDINPPRLDSWASRVVWRRAAWEAQFSGGHLHEPEWYQPWDQTRLSASVAYNGIVWSRPFSMTGAWGRMLENVPSYSPSQTGLLEWNLRTTRLLTTYGRAELAKKEVIGLHVHPPGTPPHPQVLSDVGALTFGLVHDLRFFGLEQLGHVGIGGDITLYAMQPELETIYGGSKSFHVFVRWRPQLATGTAHVH